MSTTRWLIRRLDSVSTSSGSGTTLSSWLLRSKVINTLILTFVVAESALDDSIKVEKLIEFFEAEDHNIIAFGDIDARKHFRSLALKFGVDYEPFVSNFH
jgi:hypothetical protein